MGKEITIEDLAAIFRRMGQIPIRRCSLCGAYVRLRYVTNIYGPDVVVYDPNCNCTRGGHLEVVTKDCALSWVRKGIQEYMKNRKDDDEMEYVINLLEEL